MTVGDVYELVDVQTFLGQEVLNVYFYEQIALLVILDPSETLASVLANQWIAGPLDTIKAGQSGDVTHTAIRVRNLFDESDQAEVLISLPGLFSASSGDSDSAFVALGIKESTNNGSIRPGSKRIAGQPSNVTVDGVITDSTYLTSSLNTANTLSDNIPSDAPIPVDTWQPVVVKRIKETIAGKVKYRLPNVITEKVVGIVVSALFNAVLTSQVSRKVGHGV